jgi:mRNA-degrading endonuclease RelE of RelBE toxin-antitoxin system
MPFQLLLHEQASLEYIAAYEWYELKQKGLGDSFMNAVEDCLVRIKQQPALYSKIKGNFRQIKVHSFPYTIVYEFFPRKKLIHIAAIHHTSRHPKRKIRKK